MEEPLNIEMQWNAVCARLSEQLGKNPDLNAVLFLIGIQESGRLANKFSKEQKQDLMHVAICHLLSQDGYYSFSGRDDDGWPHYHLVQPLPEMNTQKQELMLKKFI